VVDEAAEAVESLDWACAGLRWRVWGSEAECAVGTLAVVVVEVLADDVGEVTLVSDHGSSRGTRGGSCGRTARHRRSRPVFGLGSGSCGLTKLALCATRVPFGNQAPIPGHCTLSAALRTHRPRRMPRLALDPKRAPPPSHPARLRRALQPRAAPPRPRASSTRPAATIGNRADRTPRSTRRVHPRIPASRRLTRIRIKKPFRRSSASRLRQSRSRIAAVDLANSRKQLAW
jgi:hypothetical protein